MHTKTKQTSASWNYWNTFITFLSLSIHNDILWLGPSRQTTRRIVDWTMMNLILKLDGS